MRYKLHAIRKNISGFTLIEVMIGIVIVALLTVGIYNLLLFSLRITSDNKFYVEAIEIANQKMEQIRNLPYSDVGVQGGTPNGVIPQVELISRDGNFTVNTYIKYHDDPYDGEAGGGDTIINDYKIATIKVGWLSKYGLKNVTVFSKIIPRTEETAEGYGLLKIFVGGYNFDPIEAANVRVVNNSLVPAVDVPNPTNSAGILYLPALEAPIQTYEITVTKAGYGTDQSYDLSAGKSPIHLTVTEGNKTEEAFSIDQLATLQIRTVSTSLPDNWQVNQTLAARDQINTNFSVDSANNMYFVWQSYTATSSYVFAQKYNSSQVKQWTNDYKISDTKFQTNPDIITTTAGNSFIVWQDNSNVLKQLIAAKKAEIKLAKLLKNPQSDSSWTTKPIAKSNLKLVTANDHIIEQTSIINSPFQSKTKILKIITDNFNNVINFFRQGFKINQANAADPASIVQTKISNVINSSNSISTSFDNSPTEGNVIIAIAMHRNDYASFNAPTNSEGSFTESAYSDSDWYLDVGIWHKVVGATQPSQVNITSNGNMDGGVLMLMEIAGLDINNLVDVITTNDQTGNISNTAYTGATANSVTEGFAVAAIGWGDGNFTNPNSSNWSSDSADLWVHRLWREWESWWINDGSLGVATLDVTASAAQGATLTLTGGDAEQRNSALAVFRVAQPNDATVSATSSQVAFLLVPSTDQYVGGAFTITDNLGSHDVTDITITESGTVDAQNNLANIKLFYDLDASPPYDCASEQYDAGSDSQFGSATSFDSSDGIATFSAPGGIQITTTQTICVYVVLDVASGASKDETLEIIINDPSSDVVLDYGTVIPGTAVEISGTTNLLKPADLEQIHFRWRNDDGSESLASWKEIQDAYTTNIKGSLIRLRFAISNEGSFDSDPAQYRIEYGEKLTSCSGIASWVALPSDSSQHWQIADSANLTDGEATTNNAGLTDENINFIAASAHDATNQTAAIILTSDDFTEIEYSIKATDNSTDSDYCFRLTNTGATDNFTYTVYPEIAVVGDENIYLVSLDNNGNELWSVKKVNSDSTNEDQANPSIAITQDFATTTIVWQDGRDGNINIYAQSFDAAGNKLWGNDMQITSSATNDYSPKVAVDSSDNIIVAWVNTSGASKDIYLHKYDLNATNVWATSLNVINYALDEYEPDLAVDSSDNIYLSWTEDNGGILNVKLAKFDSAGANLWQGQANLESGSFNQNKSAIYLNNSNSTLYIVWTDDREGNEDIYAQKYDTDGAPQWSEDLKISINLTLSSQINPVLIVNSASEPFAAWQDNRDSNYNIYATKFNDPGALNSVANVPIRVVGTKTICETPVAIYEYNQANQTDANGSLDLSVEWDTGYSLEIEPPSAYNIILRDPIQPLDILPAETLEWLIYVE